MFGRKVPHATRDLLLGWWRAATKRGKQPPGWGLRQRRERKEFEIQIKSKLSSFLAQPINAIQRSFLSHPSLKK
jgi:hypothetical protein